MGAEGRYFSSFQVELVLEGGALGSRAIGRGNFGEADSGSKAGSSEGADLFCPATGDTWNGVWREGEAIVLRYSSGSCRGVGKHNL